MVNNNITIRDMLIQEVRVERQLLPGGQGPNKMKVRIQRPTLSLGH